MRIYNLLSQSVLCATNEGSNVVLKISKKNKIVKYANIFERKAALARRTVSNDNEILFISFLRTILVVQCLLSTMSDLFCQRPVFQEGGHLAFQAFSNTGYLIPHFDLCETNCED